MLTRPERPGAARAVWLRYSRWLVAGLTFQLAADIIATSTARIGRHRTVRRNRRHPTFLSFFLERHQRERQDVQRDAA